MKKGKKGRKGGKTTEKKKSARFLRRWEERERISLVLKEGEKKGERKRESSMKKKTHVTLFEKKGKKEKGRESFFAEPSEEGEGLERRITSSTTYLSRKGGGGGRERLK